VSNNENYEVPYKLRNVAERSIDKLSNSGRWPPGAKHDCMYGYMHQDTIDVASVRI
jgi:hypothetical protein